MEQLLIKLARQLESLDEASLMALWEKYANIVSQFEPTKRWEDLVEARSSSNSTISTNNIIYAK